MKGVFGDNIRDAVKLIKGTEHTDEFNSLNEHIEEFNLLNEQWEIIGDGCCFGVTGVNQFRTDLKIVAFVLKQ